MPHGASIVVVADANVLLSAVAGKAASRVLHSGIEIHTTEHTWAELLEYLPEFQLRFGRTLDEMELALAVAPVRRHGKTSYSRYLGAAERLLAIRDPDDVDLAALSLKLKVPVWSNDNDFKDFPTGRFTTAELLKLLET